MATAPVPHVLFLAAKINRSGTIDEQLRFAITNKLLVQIVYGDGTRVIEPNDYGSQKGIARLLAYQRFRIGGAPRKSAAGWRLFDVPKIERCVVQGETFAGSRERADQHHYVWDLVFARVS